MSGFITKESTSEVIIIDDGGAVDGNIYFFIWKNR